MKEEIKDIKQNIIELRNRIIRSQDFKVSVKEFKQEEAKQETRLVDRPEFAKIWMATAENKLWMLHFDLGSAYIITHSNSLIELENNIEKLMIEIDKLDIMQKQKPKEEPKPKEKPPEPPKVPEKA